MTIAKNEFSDTFVSRHLTNNAEPSTKSEETKEGPGHERQTDSETQQSSSLLVHKQKITISKDAGKRRKRIEVVQGQNNN